jgi:hypothetical protein
MGLLGVPLGHRETGGRMDLAGGGGGEAVACHCAACRSPGFR